MCLVAGLDSFISQKRFNGESCSVAPPELKLGQVMPGFVSPGAFAYYHVDALNYNVGDESEFAAFASCRSQILQYDRLVFVESKTSGGELNIYASIGTVPSPDVNGFVFFCRSFLVSISQEAHHVW